MNTNQKHQSSSTQDIFPLFKEFGSFYVNSQEFPIGWENQAGGSYMGHHAYWDIAIYPRKYTPTEAFRVMDLSLARVDDGLDNGWLSQDPVSLPDNTFSAEFRYVTYLQGAAIKIPIWSTQVITGIARGAYAGGGTFSECPDPNPHESSIALQKNEYVCTSPFSIEETFCVSKYITSVIAPILDSDNRARQAAIQNGLTILPLTNADVTARLQAQLYAMVIEKITKTVSMQIDTCITEGDVVAINPKNTLFDGLKKKLWYRSQVTPPNHTIGIGLTGTLNSSYGIAFSVGAGQYFVPFNTDNATTLQDLAVKIANVKYDEVTYPFSTSLVWSNNIVTEVLVESTIAAEQVFIDNLRIAATPNTTPSTLPTAEIKGRTAAPFVEADIPVVLDYNPNETSYTAFKNLNMQLEDLFVNDPHFRNVDKSTLQLHVSRKYAYMLQKAPTVGINGQIIEPAMPNPLSAVAIALGIGEVSIKPNMQGNVWILTPKGNIYFAVNSSNDANTFETLIGGYGARDKHGKSLEGWLLVRWAAMAGTTFEYYRHVATNMGGCYDGSIWGQPDPKCLGAPFTPNCDISIFANY